MKIKELRQKSDRELGEILKQKRENLRQFNFNLGSAKAKNTKEARELRKDIARILTIMKQR